MTKAKRGNVGYNFDLRLHVTSSVEMVAKKLLVDYKITACVKLIMSPGCYMSKVSNRKATFLECIVIFL